MSRIGRRHCLKTFGLCAAGLAAPPLLSRSSARALAPQQTVDPLAAPLLPTAPAAYQLQTQVGGTTYFAAYWIKDGITDYIGNHDWLPGGLFANAVSYAQNDYEPIVIEGYDTGATR